MIRFISLLTVTLICFSFELHAQDNIFDCDNSTKFAKYLFNSAQYDLAKHELERLNYFCGFDSVSNLLLLKSYRKLNSFNDINSFFYRKNISELNQLNPQFRLEYIRGLMIQKEYELVQNQIDKGLNIDQKYEYTLGTNLLLKNWNEAYQIGQSNSHPLNYKISGLTKVANESYLAKRKKPWLATLMSAVVPGSGKIYCGYWGDGVIAFLFTASSSFFAYRAFNKYGTQKIYPWIAGGLAASYYIGNIYGGNRAAIHYNEHLDHQFIHETEQILYSDY